MNAPDPSGKVKFAAARELIKERHYDEARALLRTIDHPSAVKWLAKLDEIDRRFPDSSVSGEFRASDDSQFEQWLEIEKTLHVFAALCLVLVAAYLWIADPFRPLLTFLLFDKPTIRNIIIIAIPMLCVVFALFGLWRSTQDERMRRFLLRMKAGRLRTGAIVSLTSAVMLMAFAVSQSDGILFFLSTFAIIVAMLNLWRAAKAARLHVHSRI